jgi:hypothetical protein
MTREAMSEMILVSAWLKWGVLYTAARTKWGCVSKWRMYLLTRTEICPADFLLSRAPK